MLSINADLLALIKNKRVALVGPAPYLQGGGAGRAIEEYDIVVRPNTFTIPTNLHCDYGSRTDIMFHNYGNPWMPDHLNLIDSHPEDYGRLKMLCCVATKASPADSDYLSWPATYTSAVVENMRGANKNNIPSYWIGVEDYKKIYGAIGAEPNTGMGALITLLQYPVKEIYLTGFTLYQGGTCYEDIYFEGYAPPTDREIVFGNGGLPGHGTVSIQRHWLLLKKILSSTSLLKVDPFIQDLFNSSP